jgi:hypothetical protein
MLCAALGKHSGLVAGRTFARLPTRHRSSITDHRPLANSLLLVENSLLRVQKFPAPLPREFRWNPLILLSNIGSESASGSQSRRNSLQIPSGNLHSETGSIRTASSVINNQIKSMC